MQATLLPDEASQRRFWEWYIRKYRDRKPDLIIAVGLEPLKFMIESHESFFPGIPIIFCGTTEEMLDQLKVDSHFTGVWAVARAGENTGRGTRAPTRNQARGRGGWRRKV